MADRSLASLGTSITLAGNPTVSSAATINFSRDNNLADPDFLFDYPHPTRIGYQRLSREVQFR